MSWPVKSWQQKRFAIIHLSLVPLMFILSWCDLTYHGFAPTCKENGITDNFNRWLTTTPLWFSGTFSKLGMVMKLDKFFLFLWLCTKQTNRLYVAVYPKLRNSQIQTFWLHNSCPVYEYKIKDYGRLAPLMFAWLHNHFPILTLTWGLDSMDQTQQGLKKTRLDILQVWS